MDKGEYSTDYSESSKVSTQPRDLALSKCHIGINPNYGLYMTLGLIPKSHFLTAGTDPNVRFGQTVQDSAI